MTNTLIAPASTERRIPMTYEAWLTWSVGETRSEWVAGEVIVFMPTTLRHGLIVGFVYRLLASYVEFFNLGVAVMESLRMKLDGADRVPDIIFVSDAHRQRLTNQQLTGPADLVVEVISDDSVERDSIAKFDQYAAAGVPEFWLVDARANHRAAAFFQLVDGVYRAVPPDTDGRYRSLAVPGFWLRPAWLTADPLPDSLDCLFAIAPEILAAKLRRATELASAEPELASG